jgi:hypothetical protein
MNGREAEALFLIGIWPGYGAPMRHRNADFADATAGLVAAATVAVTMARADIARTRWNLELTCADGVRLFGGRPRDSCTRTLDSSTGFAPESASFGASAPAHSGLSRKGGDLNWSTQHSILDAKDGVSGDQSRISSRFHCGRQDGVVGSVAAWGVADSDWASV